MKTLKDKCKTEDQHKIFSYDIGLSKEAQNTYSHLEKGQVQITARWRLWSSRRLKPQSRNE